MVQPSPINPLAFFAVKARTSTGCRPAGNRVENPRHHQAVGSAPAKTPLQTGSHGMQSTALSDIHPLRHFIAAMFRASDQSASMY